MQLAGAVFELGITFSKTFVRGLPPKKGISADGVLSTGRAGSTNFAGVLAAIAASTSRRRSPLWLSNLALQPEAVSAPTPNFEDMPDRASNKRGTPLTVTLPSFKSSHISSYMPVPVEALVVLEGGGCKMRATHSTNYVSMLQPMKKANVQRAESTHIFDDNFFCRQPVHKDVYELFIRILCHHHHGGTALRRRCRWKASFGDGSMRFSSRHVSRPRPIITLGSVLDFGGDSRSGRPGLHVTSDNAFASRPRRRRKAAGIKQCLTKSATNCKEAAGIPELEPLQKTPIHLLRPSLETRGGLDVSLRHKQKNVSGKRPIFSTEEDQLMPRPPVHELLQMSFLSRLRTLAVLATGY